MAVANRIPLKQQGYHHAILDGNLDEALAINLPIF